MYHMKKLYTFRLYNEETFARFKDFCKTAGTPMNKALNESIELYLDKHTKKNTYNPSLGMTETPDRFVNRRPGYPAPLLRPGV